MSKNDEMMVVRERPILFSGPMVRAILEGRKTQTRRPMKLQPPDEWAPIGVGRYCPTVVDRHGEEVPGEEIFGVYDEDWGDACPYGGPGDRLWVREAWNVRGLMWGEKPSRAALYASDDAWVYAATPPDRWSGRWRAAIHMPRRASRITLDITHVRVERLQDISDIDLLCEGVEFEYVGSDQHRLRRSAFARLWDTIYSSERSWEANPWVWVISFRQING